METKFLRLFLSIFTMFTVTDLLSLHELKSCAITSGGTSTNVKPITYTVNLKIMPHYEVISGSTDIIIDVKQATTNIRLHARNLEVNFLCTLIMKPDQPPGCFGEETIAYRLWAMVYCPRDEILLLIFSDFIPPGIHVLHIEHSSRFNESLYKITYPYSWTGIERRWLVTNLYDQNSTRELFPCWDDPTVKAHFEIIIKHDRIFTLFSTVPVRYTVAEKNDMQSTYFIKIYPMSTYHLAFAMVRGVVNKTEQLNVNHLWHRLKKKKLLEYAHTIIHQITINFENDLNVILSNEIIKIDHVVLPKCPMKSAGKLGLVIYREEDVTFDENLDFDGQKIDIAKLVAYEVVRQLLLGYIKTNVNHELWINEMLASFYGYCILDKMWLGARAMELFVVQNLQTALDSDIYLELEPVFHKAKDDTGIDGLLYPLLYHKKVFVLMRMLYHLLTPRYFLDAIKKYVQSRTDFWTVLQGEYIQRGSDKYTIREIIESWLTEKHHPEMYFNCDYDKKIVEYNVTCPDKVCKFKIPFTYVTTTSLKSYNTANVTWYDEREKKLFLDLNINFFFLANMEQVGYYRVNYNRRNWILLSAYIQYAVYRRIPALNRAQIINDAFYFTTAGKMEPEVFFDVIQFLRFETDYIPWYPMFNVFSYMSTYLKSPTSNVTKTNFLYCLGALLGNIGYEEQVGEDDMTKALRLLAIKWACEFGHAECRSTMTKKFMMYITSKSKLIMNPRWTDWISCTVMMNFNMNDWKIIKENGIEYKNIQIFEILACTENESIIIHYMYLILNTDLEAQAGIKMAKEYLYVIKKHLRKDAILEYVLDNYSKAVTRFPADFGNNTLMGHIIMSAHSLQQLDEIYLGISKLLDKTHYEWNIFHIFLINRKNQLMKMLKTFKMFHNNGIKVR